MLLTSSDACQGHGSEVQNTKTQSRVRAAYTADLNVTQLGPLCHVTLDQQLHLSVTVSSVKQECD